MIGASNRFVVSLCIVIQASTTASGGISYNEELDGDLPFQIPLPIFDFEFGENVFNGSLFIRTPDLQRPSIADLDSDKFAFRVPAGAQVDSIVMTFVDDEGDFLHSGWFLRAGLLPFGPGDAPEFIEGHQVIESPSTTVWSEVPLGAGTYNLASGGIGTTSFASADYSIVFVVSAVPEPGTLWLLGVAAQIAFVGRRTRCH